MMMNNHIQKWILIWRLTKSHKHEEFIIHIMRLCGESLERYESKKYLSQFKCSSQGRPCGFVLVVVGMGQGFPHAGWGLHDVDIPPVSVPRDGGYRLS